MASMPLVPCTATRKELEYMSLDEKQKKRVLKLFRELTDEEKDQLRGPFKEIAKDLKELRDYFRKEKV